MTLSRFVCAALLLALARPAAAQTVTGTIQGTVTDTSGAVLPGVTITLTQVETGTERAIITNGEGIYNAPFLQIGRYTVKAELPGFGTVVRQNIDVRLNDTRVVDIALNPTVTQEVTVTAEVPRVNLTNAEVKGSLTAEQIMDKPSLSASSFLGLAETFTGFQDNPTGGQNNPTASSGSSINFNGTGTRGATFQINGVNNDDSSENQHRQGAALSTILEFQVLKNGYSAEFGRGDGSVVLVQTKSGTNDYHGDLYLYQQNGAWNAKSFFAQAAPKPVRHRSEYGFTLGGPVVRKRLFGFGNVDRTRNDGENPYIRDFFTPAELAAPRLTRGNDTPENRAWIEAFLARFPRSLVNNDSRSPRTFAGVAGFDFPDEDASARLDWSAGRNSTLTGRYQWTRQIRDPQDVIAGEQAYQKNRQQNLGITWTRVLTSSIVGEARYGLGLRSTNVDIADGNDTPIVRFTASPVSGSIVGNAGNFPIHRDQRDHQFVYNLSVQAFRTHTLKLGTDIRRQALDDLADNNSRGFWTFNASCGGVTYPSPYAALLDGCVNSFVKAYGPFFLENRQNEANVYVQDDWQIGRSLKLNLGLRYEYVEAPREVENRVDYIFKADDNNLEPRLGFAYAPTWDHGVLGALSGGAGNFSIRGGWGIYDGRLFQSIFSQSGANIRFNPPNAISRTFNAQPNILNVSDPSLGFVFVPGPQTGRVSLTLPDPDLEMPSTTKWNIGFDRAMPWNSTLRVQYQGNHNDKRLRYAQGNLPRSPLDGPITVVDHPNNAPTGSLPDVRGKVIDRIAADALCAGTGFFGLATTAACPNPVPIADNEISVRVPRTNERRPDPRYTTNLLISNDAESWYDGVEFEWDKRFSHGVQFQAAYTFSKSTDTTSEATFVGAGDTNQTGPNRQFAKGLARYHTPHRFTLNGSWRMPFFADRRDLAGQLLGGWQLSGVARLASGTPFSVVDTSLTLDTDFDGFNESSRPVIVDRSVIGAHVTDPDTATQILPRGAFRSLTVFDTYDDISPRNGFYTPGTKNVDLALAKVFPMPWQGQTMSVRIEAFNAFNTVKFGFPVNDIANNNFGRLISGATSYAPRTLQLVLRYRY
ncbi:MAG TPA: TonB-dependent receptor [Vicinamibacterales bacterium]|nr:TonB-dependent receptor [Vicinamibacterales bacterium]